MTSLVDTAGLAGTVFSDGWRSASGDAVVEVVEPATGKTLARAGVADAADVPRPGQIGRAHV